MKNFRYNGKIYKPLRKFIGNENTTDIFKMLSNNTDNTPQNYSWEGFYEVANKSGAGDIDVFLYKNRLVVPTQYGLDTLKQ